MNRITFIPITIIALSSCNRLNTTEQELKNNLNKKLQLNMFETIRHKNDLITYDEFRKQFEHISVVYLQNRCSSCYSKFIEWQNNVDSVAPPDDYTVLFIIQGQSYEEFMTSILDIDYIDDQYYCIIDVNYKFMENNKGIPRWIIDSSILIDSDNKIKMVGAPFATPEMTKLFHKICKN
jgi:hypothetical protein